MKPFVHQEKSCTKVLPAPFLSELEHLSAIKGCRVTARQLGHYLKFNRFFCEQQNNAAKIEKEQRSSPISAARGRLLFVSASIPRCLENRNVTQAMEIGDFERPESATFHGMLPFDRETLKEFQRSSTWRRFIKKTTHVQDWITLYSRPRHANNWKHTSTVGSREGGPTLLKSSPHSGLPQQSLNILSRIARRKKEAKRGTAFVYP